MIDFKSRPREGGDPYLPPLPLYKIISSHAPARGATRMDFMANCVRLFQVTPPRGGRHSHPDRCQPCAYFKSRPREGGDLRSGVGEMKSDIFQVTPPRGGRRNDITVITYEYQISSHAPARGATAQLHKKCYCAA